MEEQPNNIIVGKDYIFFVNDEKSEIGYIRIKGKLIGTSQPCAFSPVFFDILTESEPEYVTHIKVSDVKKILQRYDKKTFDHQFQLLVAEWKKYFAEKDEMQFFEYVIKENGLNKRTVLTVADYGLQAKLIAGFKKAKIEVEKHKPTEGGE